MNGARLCSLLGELGYEGHRTIYPDSFEWPFQYEEDAPAFELSLYFVEREAAKTADMKEKGVDPYDLKQQENVLAESRIMIPDCCKRLESSLADLKGILLGSKLGKLAPTQIYSISFIHHYTAKKFQNNEIFCKP
ncbi:putative tubulin binding cofactor A [Helianthus annuus]|uniref:Tubulin-specific chaperone A n=1 Tax=Helianthus annuus TaxID=4232 RepID=A0A9K3JNT9_HELAN|nr:putative tubulin binding cofactor A [Helianthus annuus]KAJ0604770.1 putative tubulin binding cofactor A [Helianthus annuus]KAJ0615366.1 putative tubulin binding cofactor A [Helianthus annuus]KAJ0618785.1 putative tubulin binding cofactor A [Helianthus annuus]KAJ0777244.1 putative tubulin binding cofactor A [Helianthus annuus]